MKFTENVFMQICEKVRRRGKGRGGERGKGEEGCEKWGEGVESGGGGGVESGVESGGREKRGVMRHGGGGRGEAAS